MPLVQPHMRTSSRGKRFTVGRFYRKHGRTWKEQEYDKLVARFTTAIGETPTAIKNNEIKKAFKVACNYYDKKGV